MGKEAPLEKGKIMSVAAALFGEKGYSATSVRDISQALNVSIATIYYYFKNKEDLLYTIIDTIGSDLLAMLRKATEASDDPLDQFRRMVYGHIRLALKRKDEVKVYVEEQVNLSKKFKAIIYRQHRAIYDTYTNQLEELRKRKLIRFEEIPILAFAMFGMVNWSYRWYREEGEMGVDDVARTIVDLFFNGILNPMEKPMMTPKSRK